jgi:hypothetical protein
MIGLIPFVINDYTLTSLYILLIGISLYVKHEKNDVLFFMFGFSIMIFFEYLFITTGVEIFVRKSLLNVMPLWLPFLWGYGFIAIKRSVKILEK